MVVGAGVGGLATAIALRDALVRGAGAALHRVGEGRWRASGT
ncbi:hypothetical protein ACWGAN_09190 [Streptomyces sp. NPDC054945]